MTLVKNFPIAITILMLSMFGCNKSDDSRCDSVEASINRVAFCPEFRKGTWVNMVENDLSKDTIVFHNDSIWSNYYYRQSTGQVEGVFNKKYDFVNIEIVTYDGFDGASLDVPLKRETSYDEDIGVFSINRGAQFGGISDHYEKID